LRPQQLGGKEEGEVRLKRRKEGRETPMESGKRSERNERRRRGRR
jgi:hypothetical protein